MQNPRDQDYRHSTGVHRNQFSSLFNRQSNNSKVLIGILHQWKIWGSLKSTVKTSAPCRTCSRRTTWEWVNQSQTYQFNNNNQFNSQFNSQFNKLTFL
jgi:hypothetical protein